MQTKGRYDVEVELPLPPPAKVKPLPKEFVDSPFQCGKHDCINMARFVAVLELHPDKKKHKWKSPMRTPGLIQVCLAHKLKFPKILDIVSQEGWDKLRDECEKSGPRMRPSMKYSRVVYVPIFNPEGSK